MFCFISALAAAFRNEILSHLNLVGRVIAYLAMNSCSTGVNINTKIIYMLNVAFCQTTSFISNYIETNYTLIPGTTEIFFTVPTMEYMSPASWNPGISEKFLP